MKSSRRAYRQFVEDYKHQRLDKDDDKKTATGAGAPDAAPATEGPAKKPKTRRASLREYITWLKPHRAEVAFVFVLALGKAALELVEPQFMRFMIDNVLLNETLDTVARMRWLNMAGGLFLLVVLFSSLITLLRDYRQRLLNTRLMLSLRRSLFDRLLHLPLPKLWDMKTGGILSRLTGDVDTTTGLMQMAIISPTISVIRLIVVIVVLFVMNWRLALTVLAIIPGAMLISFISARRVRPIYRTIRQDAEDVDGRVGETFSGIRVVRAFGREVRELAHYMRGRHIILRKELFAHRRELMLWTSWGLLVSGVNVVIVWYGGYLSVH
ncbi:MAG TPA: ABC transporter ATP-binding protein, partial [Vicinamibacterales bacterium]|nr:ABC transporter ATP-binding protein [Vicinamibacterales bacterium]